MRHAERTDPQQTAPRTMWSLCEARLLTAIAPRGAPARGPRAGRWPFLPLLLVLAILAGLLGWDALRQPAPPLAVAAARD
ncbi:hypothetical protein [Maritimibacter sp. 55A14]|uniref:hypothetical protein n=1 Tax=Maritimibacter sp. 55A14 TaxID=2174844 RepID=UPI001304C485|nr:hypothetical protein [Maritimibacter sp. 55A14]